jgi:hypothetical protein
MFSSSAKKAQRRSNSASTGTFTFLRGEQDTFAPMLPLRVCLEMTGSSRYRRSDTPVAFNSARNGSKRAKFYTDQSVR